MKPGYFIVAVIGVLLLAAILIPSNPLTGRVIQEGTCAGLGCVELCTETCGGGLTCCPTHWNSGVCDLASNCDKIREYSLYQTIETYSDTVREQPQAVTTDGRFFATLLVVLMIIAYFIWQRNDPIQR